MHLCQSYVHIDTAHSAKARSTAIIECCVASAAGVTDSSLEAHTDQSCVSVDRVGFIVRGVPEPDGGGLHLPGEGCDIAVQGRVSIIAESGVVV